MCRVALNQIDSSHIICIRFLLSSVHIAPPWALLFLSALTRFLEKGKFSDRSCRLVLQESCLRCSKNLRIRRKPPNLGTFREKSVKWVLSISREYWVYLTLLAKNLEISDFWVWVWGIETFHLSKFSPATGVITGRYSVFSCEISRLLRCSQTSFQFSEFTRFLGT